MRSFQGIDFIWTYFYMILYSIIFKSALGYPKETHAESNETSKVELLLKVDNGWKHDWKHESR